MLVVGFLVGALLGGILGGRFEMALAGGAVGFIVAFLVRNARRSRAAESAPTRLPASAETLALLDARIGERLLAIERRISALEIAVGADAAVAPLRAPAEPKPILDADRVAASTGDEASTPPVTVESDSARPIQSPATAAAMADTPSVDESEGLAPEPSPDVPRTPAYAQPAYGGAPSVTPREPSALWRFLTGGNSLARVGVLVLFVGVGFLLKYAAEHVTVPIELRIAGVALGGIALLVLGWRLRDRRTAYAMILQGGGVGVLYLTVFAAFKLYALVPAAATFILLVAIAALSAVLAVRQDAIALAAVGVIGGFFAPILTSSESGNHVVLFSYYALLNAGILGIAWFKAWRLLNLLGFVCTFVIGTLWGVTRYRADDFATTEPFLVLFFLFYVAIAVLYALRRSVSVRDYVDGTIVFGTPLVTAGLQQALVRPYEFGMAISALVASGLYIVLARVLWSRHRDELRLLTESFVALGVAFATLAVPLAFDAQWTSATWALEGAAIVWVGARQRRVLARAFGLILQLAAGVAFAIGSPLFGHAPAAGALPILNSAFIGALLVALGGLVTALVYHRRAADIALDEAQLMGVLAFAWGTLWSLFAGLREIDRFVAQDLRAAAFVGFAAAVAIAYAVASRALAWPIARIPALMLGPALLVFALPRIVIGSTSTSHLFAHGGVVAWPIAIVVAIVLLRSLERHGAYAAASTTASALHAAWFWLVALVVAHEAAWAASQLAHGDAWRYAAWGVAPAIAIAIVVRFARGDAWPFGVHRRSYVEIAAPPLVFWALAWSLVVGVASDADPAPLPYVPFVNPVDLALGFIAVTVIAWIARLRAEHAGVEARLQVRALVAIVSGFALLWLTAIALRTLHYWFEIGWSPTALWASPLVQAVVSLLWTVIALAAMVSANRARARSGWIAGAALLALVVAKLFVVDLSRVGSIERIVSFIGVGLLLLLIGYLAPVPAQSKAA